MKKRSFTPHHNETNRVLPAYFRQIGSGMIVLGAIIFLLLSITQYKTDHLPIRSILSVLLVIALLFLTWSEKKTDDELISLVKLKAARIAFLLSLIAALLVGIFNTNISVNGIEAVLGMLLIYRLTIYSIALRTGIS